MLSVDYIITIISSIVELWACKKVFDYTSEVINKRISITTNFIIIIGIMIFSFMLDVNADVRVIICICLTLYLYKNNYNIDSFKCSIVVFLYWMMLIGINALSMSIVFWCNALESMNILLVNSTYRYQAILLGKIILIIVLNIYRIFNVKATINKKDIIYMVVPIVANLVALFIFYRLILESIKISNIDRFEVFAISIILFISNISLILGINKIIQNNIKFIELSKLNEKIEKEYNYYKTMKENQDKIKQLYHDMKNHIICLRQMNKNNNDTTSYINSIEDKLDYHNNKFDTGNTILDIILEEKNSICIENYIDFECKINFTKCNFIKDEDVCAIFSNIIDNAIEACKSTYDKKRKILIDGAIIGKLFIMKATNTKSNNIIIKNNIIYTTKNNKNYHGLGIRSIRSSLESYNGELTIDYTEEKFIANILIPLN